MRVFNLAEELEKERKKNKELEERIKEFKLTIRTQFQKIQELIDRNDEKQDIIDKATKELINIDGNLEYGKTSDRICYVIDILKGDNK